MKGRLKSCEAKLRASLVPDERIVAVGRCEDITDRGDIDSGGAGWTFVMVTDRRLRWVPHVRTEFGTDLVLDAVSAAFEQTSAHRYAIRLHHADIRALRQVPAHRFMSFRWGNAEAVRTFGATRLAFSRRDTSAAHELRAQLAHREIVPTTLPSPPRPRREPSPFLAVLREGQ